MFFQNLSKRKILLLIINALISVLMVSCVIFLFHYLPANHPSKFTVEKDNSIHITKGHMANVRISQNRHAIDDTIYIDNDNYGDENYDNSGNFQVPVTAPVTIIERPVDPDDDFYYESYDESDDEDIVSSGDGKIVVNVKKPLAKTREPPEPVNYIENVYSVSSEIVSKPELQYNVEDAKQINKPDRSTVDSEKDDEWEASAKGKRLSGNNKSLVERSRQLLLCESARTGELCRMLFKGTAG